MKNELKRIFGNDDVTPTTTILGDDWFRRRWFVQEASVNCYDLYYGSVDNSAKVFEHAISALSRTTLGLNSKVLTNMMFVGNLSRALSRGKQLAAPDPRTFNDSWSYLGDKLDQEWYNPRLGYLRGDVEGFLYLEPEADRVHSYTSLMEQTVRGRSVFISQRNDLIGIAPSVTMVGDQLAILRGARTPIILRQRVDGSGCFEIVGDCYTHGLMQGEAFAIPGIGDQERDLMLL